MRINYESRYVGFFVSVCCFCVSFFFVYLAETAGLSFVQFWSACMSVFTFILGGGCFFAALTSDT